MSLPVYIAFVSAMAVVSLAGCSPFQASPPIPPVSGSQRSSYPFHLKSAVIAERQGRYRQAFEHAQTMLQLARQQADLAGEIQALLTLALIQRRLADFASAEADAATAFFLSEKLGNPRLTSASLRHLGAIAAARGELDKALRWYQRGLAITQPTHDSIETAKLLNNLGGLYRRLGQYPQALLAYQDSLAIREKLADVVGQIKVHTNLCALYQNLRNFKSAQASCHRALALAEQTGDRKGQAINLNHLGAIHRTLGRDEKALEWYQRSLTLKRRLHDAAGEARTLNNIGELFLESGRPHDASKWFQRSLAIKEKIGDLSGQSATLINLGQMEQALRHYPVALRYYQNALALQSERPEPEQRWRILEALRQLYLKTGYPGVSVFFGKQAVNTIQMMRSEILQMPPGQRKRFIGDKTGVYRGLADTLIDQGRLLEAQQVLKLLKEEEYFEFIRGESELSTAGQADYSQAEEHYHGHLQALLEQAGTLSREKSELRRRKRNGQLNSGEATRLTQIESDLKALRQAHLGLLKQLEEEFVRSPPDRLREFSAQNLTGLKALQGLLKDLGQNTVLIHYFVTDQRIRIILSPPDPSHPPVHFDSPIDSKRLFQSIQRFRDALQSPSRNPLNEAKSLYDRLVRPIDRTLADLHATHLLIYLDRALRYLPFAALYDGSDYLNRRFALTLYTAGAQPRLAESSPSSWRGAGMGVSKGFPALGFSPLPAVPDELKAIIRTDSSGASGVIPGKIFVDARFTRDQLASVLDSDCLAEDCYNIVHLSTHFKFHPGGLDDSFLLLGNGKRLSLADLMVGDFDFHTVDLLTLSACETALAGSDTSGREIEGLGTLVQNGGAKAVIATLWQVADRSTATFMRHFYRYRTQPGVDKAQALRLAQRTFIQGSPIDPSHPAGHPLSRGVGQIDASGRYAPPPDAPFAHPFYWAPFVLMGNWR